MASPSSTAILLSQKRDALEKIVTSRKRKLQELYRVVNHVQFACMANTRSRSGGARSSGWDEDEEKKFLERTDINLGKAFNASEMLPKPNAIVPDVSSKEATKGTAIGVTQSGDSTSGVVSREGTTSREGTEATSGEKPLKALDVKSANGNNVPKGPTTPKSSIRDSDLLAADENSKSAPKTPSRRSARTREKQGSTDETHDQMDVDMGDDENEGPRNIQKVSAEAKAAALESGMVDTPNDEDEDATDAAMDEEASETTRDLLPSEIPSESINVQSKIDKPSSPPPLERIQTSTSQKSEPPTLAISTRPSQSPEVQVHRPFPTPTTATEAESSIPRPPTSAPEKSVEPPSPADSAVVASDAEPEEVELEVPRPPRESHEDEGVGDEEDTRAEDLSEIEVAASKQIDQDELDSSLHIDAGDTSKVSDEDLGEVEKQLQLESALSKQLEAPKEDITVDAMPDESVGLAGDQRSTKLPGSESEDIDTAITGNHSTKTKGTTGTGNDEEMAADSEQLDEADAVIPEAAKILGAAEEVLPAVGTSAPINPTSEDFGKAQVIQNVVADTKQEDFEAANEALVEDEGGEAIAEDPEDLKETLGAVSPIKREEHEDSELDNVAPQDSMAEDLPVVLPTPSDIPASAGHDHSAIAETPMSVDEPVAQTASPKSVQQPLTTAALESINTTVSTPATRTSSTRREKPLSVNGGLQLAKIVFHGRSTATSATSKPDGSSSDISPSNAPAPVRVGTRSGSISTPARMNSRSLEAQRISSLAELREQHQQQLREQHELIQGRKSGASEKSKIDVFDYLAAVTASEPLQNSLATSHKTLSTSAFQLLRREKQAIQALTEIQDLQKQGKWSLMQPARAVEPPKQMAQWDFLLREVKWLSKDFKEGRKWNVVVAKKLADACSAWCQAGPEERKTLCVRRTTSGRPRRSRHMTQVPTPELVPSDQHSDDEMADDDEEDHMRDDFVHRLHEVESAGNLFALAADDIVFEILHNSTTDSVLAELPIYGAPKFEVGAEGRPVYFDGWKNNEPLGPAAGLKRTLWEVHPEDEGPPVKKSRYDYDPDYRLLDSDDEDDDSSVVRGNARSGSGTGIARSGSPILQPKNTSVALFNPDFQPVLQRLHNAHIFRPPQEMPPATFFEYRTPSQWTTEEDKELVNAVKKYNHNWWLVSQVMQPKSFLQSGADRRSLWECFERWVMLEPQNAEVIKGPFFKPVQQRLELAARAPTHAGAAAHQQSGATATTPGGANSTAQPGTAGASTASQPPKRKTSQPMRVERKRNTRTLNMIEQMRKLAKKREVQASKQAQSTNIAIKKQQEQSAQAAQAPRAEQYTPQQVSRMKHEKDLLHRQQAQMAQMAQLQRRQAQSQGQATPASQQTGQATAQPNATATPAATVATPSATPQSNNNIPAQSRNNLQVPNMQNSPAASAPTTAQQSLLAAQQRQLLAAAAQSNPTAIQVATQQVNQHLRAQGHTVATNGQNGPTSVTPEQYKMLIQARMQANAIKIQQVQAQAAVQAAQAQFAASGSHPQLNTANASQLHAMSMQAAQAAARAHNSGIVGQQSSPSAQVQAMAAAGGAGSGNQGNAAGHGNQSSPSGHEVISAQAAMMRIKQTFPTIRDDYIHKMIMQHQAQAKQLGKDLTYAHITNLIHSLAAQAAAASNNASGHGHQGQQQNVQSAQNALLQQQQQQQQQLVGGQGSPQQHHMGVSHVGAGAIHHPSPPVNRSGGSATAQQMLNQLRMAQTRAPSSSPMMGNATPVMSAAAAAVVAGTPGGATSAGGVVSRGNSATPMQRGGSYHTPTPGSTAGGANGNGQQGSPRPANQISGM